MSKFPAEVWDGRSPSRQDLGSEFPPTYQDWMTLLKEVQAMQQYLLAVTGNIQAMPNLDAALSDCSAKIKELDTLIADRTPPEDLRQELKTQGELIVESDCRTNVAQLASEIQAIRSEKLESDLTAAKTGLEKTQCDARFKSDHGRDYAAFKSAILATLEEIKAQVKRIEGLVSLQQAVSKLQNLES